MIYASYGQGAESEVAPGRSRYTNAGQPLPTLKSEQTEIGIKSTSRKLSWNITAFDVTRPVSGDLGACDVAGTCTRQIDGEARHRGIELGASGNTGNWTLGATATFLKAERQGSTIDPSLNSKRPTNVPETIVRANAAWRVPGAPGLSLLGTVSYEGGRSVLPDESVTLPAWTRLDLGVRYETHWGKYPTTLSLLVDNVANSRYFTESPYQYGHVYLFPAAPRIARLVLQTSF